MISKALSVWYLVIFFSLAGMASLYSYAEKIYSGEPVTIAHDFLSLEKELGADKKHVEYINGLINRAGKTLSVKQDYSTEDAIKIMLQIHLFIKHEGFEFKPNYLLSTGIDKKQLDCDNYCVLYTAIAEVLKIPIIPVYAPNHSFLRFNFNDGSYLNWEPTEGKHYPNAYYIKKLKIAETSIKQGVYLRSLSRKEFIGVEHNNIGAYLLSQKDYVRSVKCFSTAIALYPAFSSAYHNRGSALYALKRPDQAEKDLLSAVRLDPMRAGTYNTLGDIYLDKKDYDRAEKYYLRSIELDPYNFVPYNNMAFLKNAAGRKGEAKIWIERANRIKQKYDK